MSKNKSEKPKQEVVEQTAYAIERRGDGWVLSQIKFADGKLYSKVNLSEPDILAITISKLQQIIGSQ